MTFCCISGLEAIEEKRFGIAPAAAFAPVVAVVLLAVEGVLLVVAALNKLNGFGAAGEDEFVAELEFGFHGFGSGSVFCVPRCGFSGYPAPPEALSCPNCDLICSSAAFNIGS